jgi:hypothetical protein
VATENWEWELGIGSLLKSGLLWQLGTGSGNWELGMGNGKKEGAAL